MFVRGQPFGQVKWACFRTRNSSPVRLSSRDHELNEVSQSGRCVRVGGLGWRQYEGYKRHRTQSGGSRRVEEPPRRVAKSWSNRSGNCAPIQNGGMYVGGQSRNG